MLAALTLYALFGGADYGGGLWDLLARGPRAQAQRDLIAHAIGPVWEANHVWLILVIVILFTAFPPAFRSVMTYAPPADLADAGRDRPPGVGLHLPELRHLARGRPAVESPVLDPERRHADPPRHDRRLDRHGSARPQRRLGPLARRRSRSPSGCSRWPSSPTWRPSTSRMEADDPELADDFRVRAIASSIASGILALVVYRLARDEAPLIFRGSRSSPWGFGVRIATAIDRDPRAGLPVRRRYAIARAVGDDPGGARPVRLRDLALHPYLIPPGRTIENSASPAITLRLMLGAMGRARLILFPSPLLSLPRLQVAPRRGR